MSFLHTQKCCSANPKRPFNQVSLATKSNHLSWSSHQVRKLFILPSIPWLSTHTYPGHCDMKNSPHSFPSKPSMVTSLQKKNPLSIFITFFNSWSCFHFYNLLNLLMYLIHFYKRLIYILLKTLIMCVVSLAIYLCTCKGKCNSGWGASKMAHQQKHVSCSLAFWVCSLESTW